MKTSTLKELALSVQVSKDAQTILFIDRHSMTKEDAQKLMDLIKARVGANRVICVFTQGNPNFVIKPLALNDDGQEVVT